MLNDSEGCFVGCMKFIVLIIFIGGAILMIGKSCVTQTKLKVTNDYISVAKNTTFAGADNITYNDVFKTAFDNGDWKQYDDNSSEYPVVTFITKYTDEETGETCNLKYLFSFSDMSGDFQAEPTLCQINDNPCSIIDGLEIALKLYMVKSPLGQAIGAYQ